MDTLEVPLPLEFIVLGTPISLACKTADTKNEWKACVEAASRAVIDPSSWAVTGPVAVTIYYFPPAPMAGDIDNIAKLIIDALYPHIFSDDIQVERVVVQKFEPDRVFSFTNPSLVLTQALDTEGPRVYVRIDADPHEELVR